MHLQRMQLSVWSVMIKEMPAQPQAQRYKKKTTGEIYMKKLENAVEKAIDLF